MVIFYFLLLNLQFFTTCGINLYVFVHMYYNANKHAFNENLIKRRIWELNTTLIIQILEKSRCPY